MALDREQVGLLFKLRADSSDAQRALTQFRGVVQSTVNDVSQRANGLANSFLNVSQNLTGLTTGLTGVAGVAVTVATGLFAVARSAAAAIADLDDLTQKTGLSVETLSALKVQLEQDNVSMESFGRGVQFLQRQVVAAQTGNDDLLKSFKDLGIELGGTTEDVLRRVVARFQQLPDEAQKTAFATRLFGRAGADLVVTLNNLNGDLDAHISKMRELGLTVTPEAAKAAAEFEDQIDLLTRQFDALKIEVGNAVIPTFTDYIQKINEAVVNTKALVRENGLLLGVWKEMGRENAKRILEGVVGAGQSLGLFNPLLPNAPNLNPNQYSPAQLKALLDTGSLTQGLPPGFGGTDKDKKGKEPKLPNLPIRDFSNIVEQYFRQLGRLEEEQIKRLEQARERSARVMEDILREQQDREIEAIRAQIDQRVITEEEGAARIAAVRVAAFARTEDQLVQKSNDIDEEITKARIAAEARPFDTILQRRLQALQAERELVRRQITQTQEERTSAEERGNEAIRQARAADTQNLFQEIENKKRLYQSLLAVFANRLVLQGFDQNTAEAIVEQQRVLGRQLTLWEQIRLEAQLTASVLQQEIPTIGATFINMKNAVAESLGGLVAAFVAGRASLREAAAGLYKAALAPLKDFLLKKARAEFALGLADLAMFNFAGAAKHFLAGGALAAAAGLIDAGGSAIAGGSQTVGPGSYGGSSSQSQGGQTRIIEQGDRQRPEPQIIIIRAETEPGVVVRKVVEDYRGNGESRKLLRRDMLGDGG